CPCQVRAPCVSGPFIFLRSIWNILTAVGRKSVAHSATAQAGACSSNAQLPPQPRSRCHVFLYGQFAAPFLGTTRRTDRRFARGRSQDASSTTLHHRRLDCPARPHALLVDIASWRQRLSSALESHQGGLLQVDAQLRTTIDGECPARRTRDLATP